MELHILIPLLMLAAFSGATTLITGSGGWSVTSWCIRAAFGAFIRREHLDKTHAFYKKHGGKTILFARFLPIIPHFRTVRGGYRSMMHLPSVFYHLARWAV